MMVFKLPGHIKELTGHIMVISKKFCKCLNLLEWSARSYIKGVFKNCYTKKRSITVNLHTHTHIYMTNMTNRTKQVISTVIAVISKKFNMTNMTKKKVCLALGGLRAKRVRVGKSSNENNYLT